MHEPSHIIFHMESCCRLHGCVEGDPDCPVIKNKKNQLNICASCEYFGISSMEDLEDTLESRIVKAPELPNL